LTTFIDKNKILERSTDGEKQEMAFEKLVLLVNRQQWIRKHSGQNTYARALVNPDRSDTSISMLSKGPKVYNGVEYGIIEKKSIPEEHAEADIRLSLLLNDFKEWLDEYFQYFQHISIDKENLYYLLKLMFSK
jgi:hypothetical protein